jgi:hypothetical protein
MSISDTSTGSDLRWLGLHSSHIKRLTGDPYNMDLSQISVKLKDKAMRQLHQLGTSDEVKVYLVVDIVVVNRHLRTKGRP